MTAIRRWLGRLVGSRIYLNAYALMVNQITSAGLGFLYWMLAARLYGVDVVGASSAVISTLLLISGIAQFALGGGMQRFVPRAGASARKLIGWGYVVTVAASIVVGLAAIVVIRVFEPKGLPEIGEASPVLALLATIAWSVFTFQDGVLIGLRRSVWVLIENFTYNVAKIVLLVVAALMLNDSGIVQSWFVPTVLVIVLVTWVVFFRFLREPMEAASPGVEPPTVREVAFSVTGDHAGSMVGEAAVRVLPLMVVAALGTAENAYFYQAWMIATTVTLLAGGMSNSYSAEAAGDRRNITAYSRGILRQMALLLIPAALLMGVAAPLVLRLFGPQYAEQGTALLRWLALSTVPASFVVWHLAYSRVVGHIRTVFVVQAVRSVLMLALSYALLPALGIEAMGIAWLIVNAIVAFYGLMDSRAVLWPTGSQSGSTPGSPIRVLQRGDWRFLLPRPVANKVAVFATGFLAESARAYAAEAVDGDTAEATECDVAVARQPDADTLEACKRALAPGGICYTEWSARGHVSANSVRTKLEAAGFEDVHLYWPVPRATTARLWLPLRVKPSRLARPLGDIVRRHFKSKAGGAIATWFVRVALSVGPLPTLCAVATRPVMPGEQRREPGHAAPRCDFPFLHPAGIAPGAPEPDEYEFAIMRSGGGFYDSKVNWLLYAGERLDLRWVAKSSRHEVSALHLRHERRALAVLSKRESDKCGLAVPHCSRWVDDEVSPLFIQTALSGVSLATTLQERSYDEIAQDLTTALVRSAGRPTPVPREAWWDRLIGPRIARLAESIEGLVEPELIDSLATCLSEIQELPLVWSHNDFAPWNVICVDGRVGAFDWEEGDPRGLPAVDLIYGLAMTAFAQDGDAGKPDAVDTYERLLDPTDPRGSVFLRAIEHYAAEVGIRSEDLLRLRVVTWLWHAGNDVRNLLAGVEAPSPETLESSFVLPLLRRDLLEAERVASKTPPGACPGRVIVVSPHLDDAALSCGSGIRHLVDCGTEVTVMTLCTQDEEPGVKLSPLAVRSLRSWGLGDRPFEARRTEDAAAMLLLGADYRHLGLKDAIYRVRADGAAAYPTSVIVDPDPSDTSNVLRELDETLGPLLRESGNAPVLCPAGVGGHVDHVITRRFVESRCEPSRIVYYEECPYRMRPEAPDDATSRDGLRWQRLTFAPTPSELDARIRAVACYASQLRGLFPTRWERLGEIVSARLPFLGSLLLGPAKPERSAARSREKITEDVTTCGGEIYWLASPQTKSPFGR